jgi:hypothetical protein
MAKKRRRAKQEQQPPLSSAYVMQRMPRGPLRPALPYKRRRPPQQQRVTLEEQLAACGAHAVFVRVMVPAGTAEERRAAEWQLQQLRSGPVNVRTEPLPDKSTLGVTVGPFIVERSGANQRKRFHRVFIPKKPPLFPRQAQDK